jgi:DNA-binding transcriptional LysR family regulator
VIDRKIGSIACWISTVSQQIKRLEFGTRRPLSRRTTRSVDLTDDGEILLGDARRLLQLEEAARHRLAAPLMSGTARLGVVEEVAGGALPQHSAASQNSIRA